MGAAQEIHTNIFLPHNLPFKNLISFGHQPLYKLILNATMQLPGFDYYTFFPRLISIFFAVASGYLIFFFSQKIFKSRFISYAGFVFFNIHSLFLFYSRRIEPYSMLCFLSLLSYLYFWKTFISGEERGVWKYCLVTILCFFTHYLTFHIVLSQFLAIFILRYRTHRFNLTFSFLRFLKAMLILNFIFILYAPAIYLSIFNNPFLFQNAWSNNFYLPQENIASVLDSIGKLVLGLPLLKVIGYLPILILPFIIVKLRRAHVSFYTLFGCVVFSGLLFELLFLGGIWRCIGKTYFNVRHFVWLIPFVAIVYAYGLYILSKQKQLYKIMGYCSFSLIFIWNAYLSNELLLKNLGPSYKEALSFIKKELKDNDYVVWPVSWINYAIYFNSSGYFGGEKGSSSTMRPADLFEKELCYERFWVIVPWEDYFGIPSTNQEFLKKYINFLEYNLNLESFWKSNKINVYLFTTHNQ